MTSDPVSVERRSRQRFQLHLPLTIQVDGKTVAGFTQDVSARGLFFYTETQLAEGSVVELTFTMPSEITLAESMRMRCSARVLRSAPSNAGGSVGVAVQLDSYEYLPSLESETASELARVSTAEPGSELPDALVR